MKDSVDQNIEFDHPPSVEELIAGMSEISSDDPRSVHYKRVLIRPRLNILRVLVYVLISLAISAAAGTAAFFILNSVKAACLGSAAVLLIIAVIFAKQIAIWLVMAYQRIAPESLRKSCRYEPSCSQYMILSLQKYGFFKGLRKGLARWSRCKPPHGGYDLP